MSSLSDICFLMPLSPDFKRGVHSCLSAHVTKSGLSSSWCSWPWNSGNSCYGSTSSPWFSWMFSSCFVENSMSLSSILCKSWMNEVNKIVSDWSSENSWQCNVINNFLSIIAFVYGDNWSGGHFFIFLIIIIFKYRP